MARFMTVGLIGLGFSCVVAAPASAAPIPLTPIVVGGGDSHAFVQIDFGDGATYVFDVAFEGDVDGFGLLDQIKTDVDGFTFTLESFPFGDALNLVAYDGHSNAGFEVGSNGYWGYYTRGGAGEAWVSSMVGAGDRLATDGGWDAWTWNEDFINVEPRDVTLVPEPAALALASVIAVAVLRRR